MKAINITYLRSSFNSRLDKLQSLSSAQKLELVIVFEQSIVEAENTIHHDNFFDNISTVKSDSFDKVVHNFKSRGKK